jgi:hypothetical protein
LEVSLAASEGIVKRAIDRGTITPDHTLAVGERIYNYFNRERVEEIRVALGLPKVDEVSIKELFTGFVAEMDMASSYKPVMLLALLDCVDTHGKAKLSDVVRSFRCFYELRKEAAHVVERATARMFRIDSLDDATVQRIMLEMPFEKFERRKYLKYDRDLAYVRFDAALWRQLDSEDLARIRSICEQSIAAYYERINNP